MIDASGPTQSAGDEPSGTTPSPSPHAMEKLLMVQPLGPQAASSMAQPVAFSPTPSSTLGLTSVLEAEPQQTQHATPTDGQDHSDGPPLAAFAPVPAESMSAQPTTSSEPCLG